MGVSFKMRKRRETGKDSVSGRQRRRAARQHQSFPCLALCGYSREALRPPQQWPKVDHRAAISSFLYFERDPHDPSDVSNAPCVTLFMKPVTEFGIPEVPSKTTMRPHPHTGRRSSRLSKCCRGEVYPPRRLKPLPLHGTIRLIVLLGSPTDGSRLNIVSHGLLLLALCALRREPFLCLPGYKYRSHGSLS
jgi:hypothetical protein